MPVELDPVRLLRALEEHGVEYVVVGAQAAVVRGAPVVTRDLDITPSLERRNLDALAAALADLGARLRTATDPNGVPFPVTADMLETAELWTLLTDAGELDLVFRPDGTGGYRDLRRDADLFELADGLTVLVASLRDVIRSKEAAGREKDVAQLPLLRRTLEELGRNAP